jgi:hypothetical protein
MNGNGKVAPLSPEPLAAPAVEPANDDEAREEGGVTLDPVAQAAIGRQLQAVYGAVLDEAVPPHLLRLLDELEQKEREP